VSNREELHALDRELLDIIGVRRRDFTQFFSSIGLLFSK
jgi:uncharacterized protein YjiS (DUF1127 family)